MARATTKTDKGSVSRAKQIPVASIILNERNSRRHSQEQIDHLAGLINEFGFTIPVLVDEDYKLIAGEGRTLAAKQVGLKKVPGIVAVGWSDEQKRKYLIADNRIAESSTWDNEVLAIELRDLMPADFEGDSFLGFSTHEIDGLLNGWGADDAPDLGDQSDDLLKVIKVKCLEKDRDAVIEKLKRWSDACGIAGVEVET